MVVVRSTGRIIKKSRLNPRDKAKLVADLASDKKAEDILILEMRKIANMCDYFVVCSGTSDRQVKAIAQGIEEGLKPKGLKIYHQEGLSQSLWVLLDLGDVVVHVFDKDTREFYNLEHLWQEAPRVKRRAGKQA